MSIFGSIGLFADERGSYSGRIDRVALDDDFGLLLASVLADARIIKGMAAALNNHGASMSMALKGVDVDDGTPDSDYAAGTIKRIAEVRYECRFAKLPYGMAHALFVARQPGFLPAITEAHLWRELSSVRYTTPLLREWMPFVTEQLVARRLLLPAWCHRCRCGILRATTADLDAIVCDGIRNRTLAIDGFKHGEIEAMAEPTVLAFPARDVA